MGVRLSELREVEPVTDQAIEHLESYRIALERGRC
jgi:hypothetical protein